MKYIIFDTETTSLKPGQIAQLTYAIVDFKSKKAKGKNFYFTVDSMDRGAQYIHKLSKEKLLKLSNGRRFEDDANEIFEDFIENTLVGHNVAFDIRYINSELRKNHMLLYEPKSICTMQHYRNIVKIPNKNNTGFKAPKLIELISFFDITDADVNKAAHMLFGGATDYHDARNDVAATLLVFMKGLKSGHMKL